MNSCHRALSLPIVGRSCVFRGVSRLVRTVTSERCLASLSVPLSFFTVLFTVSWTFLSSWTIGGLNLRYLLCVASNHVVRLAVYRGVVVPVSSNDGTLGRPYFSQQVHVPGSTKLAPPSLNFSPSRLVYRLGR